MRTRALCTGLLTGAIVLIGAPAAFGASAAYVPNTLTVTGAAVGETTTVSTSGANIAIDAPGVGATDPDLAGTNCAVVSATSVTCLDSAVDFVVVNAGAGNDVVTDARSSVSDFDTLNGDAGDDVLVASGTGFSFGGLQLNGGADNDNLTKNQAASLSGGDGHDILNAGSGSLDFFDTGGPGNDTFNGSAQESDNFFAEDGSDVYKGGTYVATPFDFVDDPLTFQLFHGEDSINYIGSPARTAAQNITLDGVGNDGLAGELDNVNADVEVVTGGAGSDTLTAGPQAVVLDGQGGADAIAGGPSDDYLYGGADSDTIAGGAGNDLLNDGDFTDSNINAVLPNYGTDSLDGGAGNDSLYTDRGPDNIVGGAGEDYAEFERVIPDATTAVAQPAAGFTISLDDAANDGVTGAAEGDNVHSDVEDISTSGRASDTISGSAAANVIDSGQGNDVVDPGAGADLVYLGDGDDAANAIDQTTDRIDCGRGTDSARLDLAGAQAVRADVAVDCEGITGTAFGAVAPPVDTSKPVLKLATKTVKVKTFLKNRTLPITVTCSKPCKLSGEAFTLKAGLRVTAKVGQFKVGAGTLGTLAAGKRTLKVKVALKYMKTYKRKLRTKKQKKLGISFILAVTASDPIGIQASANKTIKVKG